MDERTTHLTPEQVVQALSLGPHPEGIFFRETYRSAARFQPSAYPGTRPYSTSIYFLMTPSSPSAVHRVRSDEVWHWYGGAPVQALLIYEDGRVATPVLGMDLAGGQRPQLVIPAGTWQGGIVLGVTWSLLGATVSPGFQFEDFELGNPVELAERHPDHATLIRAMAVPSQA